jgi:DNA-cytosine methyltransferase
MTTDESAFTFVDLFAGIGGFRFGLQAVGGKCVWSNESNKYAALTYNEWHCEKDENGEFVDPVDETDFRKVKKVKVPEHDLLAAGFPCQPFSLAGVSKNNSLNRPHGLDHEEQGNLFEHIMKLVDSYKRRKGIQRPKVLFLENVKNLKSHNNTETWAEIQRQVKKRRYHLESKVIDANRWVPQHRERIYMVCFDLDHFGDPDSIDFSWPEPPDKEPPVLGDILQDEEMEGWTRRKLDECKKTYRISKLLWESHQRRLRENSQLNEFIDRYRRNHRKLVAGAPDLSDVDKRHRFIDRYLHSHKELLNRAPDFRPADEIALQKLDGRVKEILDQERGSKKDPERLVSALNDIVKTALPEKRGFGYGEAKADGQTRTLSARYHKDGAEILYKQRGWQRPRRLTPTECGRLMGFPDPDPDSKSVSNTRAYTQYGNAVVPPVIAAIGEEIVKALRTASPPDDG